MSLHDTHMVLILSCFLGACWYFPVKVAGECPSLVLFDHFSSASTVEISLSPPSSCPFNGQKEIQTVEISNSRVKHINHPSFNSLTDVVRQHRFHSLSLIVTSRVAMEKSASSFAHSHVESQPCLWQKEYPLRELRRLDCSQWVIKSGWRINR